MNGVEVYRDGNFQDIPLFTSRHASAKQKRKKRKKERIVKVKDERGLPLGGTFTRWLMQRSQRARQSGDQHNNTDMPSSPADLSIWLAGVLSIDGSCWRTSLLMLS